MGFIEGFVNGFARAVSGSRVERLCSELGWSIDGRKGNTIRLDFNDPVIGKRPVYITDDGDGLIQFKGYSFVIIHPSRIPNEVYAYLLLQNRALPFGKWLVEEGNGEVFFALEYYAFEEGVIPPTVKVLCEQIVREAAEFDERMKKAGML